MAERNQDIQTYIPVERLEELEHNPAWQEFKANIQERYDNAVTNLAMGDEIPLEDMRYIQGRIKELSLFLTFIEASKEESMIIAKEIMEENEKED